MIYREEAENKVDLLYADKHQCSLQVGTIFFDGRFRHTQSTQINKFAILKKDMSDYFDFLYVNRPPKLDKIHQSYRIGSHF